MLSPENIRLLERFASADTLSVNDLSVWYDAQEARTRIDELVRHGYINQAEIIWGTDVYMPTVDDDTIKYRLSIKGRDFLEAREQELEESAKKIADKQASEDRHDKINERREWSRFWLGLFLGWLLGAFTPLDLWALLIRLYESVKLWLK